MSATESRNDAHPGETSLRYQRPVCETKTGSVEPVGKLRLRNAQTTRRREPHGSGRDSIRSKTVQAHECCEVLIGAPIKLLHNLSVRFTDNTFGQYLERFAR